LIGSASALTLVIATVRTKALALLLGPAGIGLMGVYLSLTDLARAVAVMGVTNSGVRQIAEAVGSSDETRIGRTATVLRRIVAILAILAIVVLVAFSNHLSMLTFGNDGHTVAIAWLAIAVALRLVTDGEAALVQGTRRIADFARMSVFGGLWGTLIALPIIYFLREDGIVLAVISIAATAASASLWYARKIRLKRPLTTLLDVRREGASLLRLGLAFMVSGLLMMGSAYAVRTIVIGQLGLEAAGFYQAAWTLGGLYVAFILQAMGTDFYPRLVAGWRNKQRCNQMVNEQAHASLLLAGPGVLATLTFAPAALSVFYTNEFSAAGDLLRWICLGMTLRVISWPMGFIIVAAGKQLIFFLTELAWAIVHLLLTWFCVGRFGLVGVGVAFFGSYFFHCFLVYPVVRGLSGFHWARASFASALLLMGAVGFAFAGFYLLPFALSTALGALLTLVSAAFSVHFFVTLASPEHTPAPIWRALVALRLVSIRQTTRI
jgi:PST family polysaccharide transporter